MTAPPSADRLERAAARTALVNRRRLTARLASVQALYQVSNSGSPPRQVIREFFEERLDEEIDGLSLAEADRKLFESLVLGVSREQAGLDEILAEILPSEWPINRLESVLLIVLRAATFELQQRPEVPARVVIAQYLTLADAFYEGRETSFANGVLDAMARRLRRSEFERGATG